MPDYIDKARAQKMIDFIQTLRIPEGMDQGSPFILRDWQTPMLHGVYSPVTESGIRVVRKAIYSVAKKNGKTPLISGIALGHLVGPEAKRNEQIYSAAFERDQAALTFRYMKQMIEMDEELSDLLNIRTATKEIESRTNGSIYKALSSEARSKHGISPAVLIFDELAQFGADREFYDTLIQGRGAHKEPLLWIISTQAADDLAILSQEIDYAIEHRETDPTVKLFFFTTPADADLQDRESWKLSNPALGDFLSEADMIEAANTAVNMPSAEPGFRNLRLNQRTSATARFMSIGVWKANGGIQIADSLSRGRITAGLDLSGKNDLSALVLDCFYKHEHNIFPYFWTPLDNAKERAKNDRVPYLLWIEQGFIEGVPGKTIDYEYIAQKVAEIHWLHHIDELRFDRWRIEDLQRALNKIGCETYIKDKEEPPTNKALCLVNHGQGFKDMNPAIESVEDVFTDNRARHNNHPVLTMCASNAVVELDPANNRKFAKHKSTGRIDGIVALAMSMNGAELPDDNKPKEMPVPSFA
jgi:phage terminase large subunit-like protein